jgi:isopenicillin-N epimerase
MDCKDWIWALHWACMLKDSPRIRFNTSFDNQQSCGIANVKVTGIDPGKIATYLMDKHKIFVVPIIHPEFKGLRITPNLFTTLPELDRFCEVMDGVARKGLPA